MDGGRCPRLTQAIFEPLTVSVVQVPPHKYPPPTHTRTHTVKHYMYTRTVLNSIFTHLYICICIRSSMAKQVLSSALLYKASKL